MNKKFRVNYDDQPNDVVDTISSALLNFNLTIEEIDGGDGWIDFAIISTNKDELKNINNAIV